MTWLFLTRPTSMYYQGSSLGERGCDYATCTEAITGIANPIIWWAATAATLYLVYRLARYREWRVGLILMGMVAGYLPWLGYLNRTVFQFYTIAFEPYLILGLTLTIGLLLGVGRHDTRLDPDREGTIGLVIVVAFLSVAALVSVFFLPLWTGAQVPFAFWQLHIWLPSWR